MSAILFHYTDDTGWKAISSQVDWTFKASPPPAPGAHPCGAYFTSLSVTTPNLSKLLRIPRHKTSFFLSFVDAGDLYRLRGGRGDFIFYSPEDYSVHKERQRQHGPVGKAREEHQ
jgi:hypothetical protein